MVCTHQDTETEDDHTDEGDKDWNHRRQDVSQNTCHQAVTAKTLTIPILASPQENPTSETCRSRTAAVGIDTDFCYIFSR